MGCSQSAVIFPQKSDLEYQQAIEQVNKNEANSITSKETTSSSCTLSKSIITSEWNDAKNIAAKQLTNNAMQNNNIHIINAVQKYMDNNNYVQSINKKNYSSRSIDRLDNCIETSSVKSSYDSQGHQTINQ